VTLCFLLLKKLKKACNLHRFCFTITLNEKVISYHPSYKGNDDRTVRFSMLFNLIRYEQKDAIRSTKIFYLFNIPLGKPKKTVPLETQSSSFLLFLGLA